MSSNNNLIQLQNLKKVYTVGETQVNALRGLSYNVQEGDLVAIMGPSGSGKSTLMNIIGCLDRPTEGKYFLEGQEVSTLDKNMLPESGIKKSVSSSRLLTSSPAPQPLKTPSSLSFIPAHPQKRPKRWPIMPWRKLA